MFCITHCSPTRWRAPFIALTAALLLVACDGLQSSDETSSRTAYGTVALPLTTTGDDGAIYHIAEAKLFLDGPQSAELVIGANAGNRFERHIAPGTYTLHVLGNVRVRRMYADGSVKDFVASLVGDAPTFDIVSGQQTPVRLDLEITVPRVDSSPTSSGTMLVDVVISFVEEVVECLPATVDKQSCGWNLEGMKLRMCEDGHWGEWTPCTAPDACDADTGIACPQAPLVTEVVLDTLTSPPSGCTGATYHTFNDCRGGFWHVVTQATYQCGTKQVVTEVHIIRTNQACESGAPVPDLADFLGVQPGNCQAPATLFTYHIPTCVHGMWQRLAYDLIQCADGSLYASRRFAADQQTTEPCESTISTASADEDDLILACEYGVDFRDCELEDGSPGTMTITCSEDGEWLTLGACQEDVTTGQDSQSEDCDSCGADGSGQVEEDFYATIMTIEGEVQEDVDLIAHTEELYAKTFLSTMNVLNEIRLGRVDALVERLEEAIPGQLAQLASFAESDAKALGFYAVGEYYRESEEASVVNDYQQEIEIYTEATLAKLGPGCYLLAPLCQGKFGEGCSAWPWSLRPVDFSRPSEMGWRYTKDTHCGFKGKRFWTECGPPLGIVGSCW